MNCEVVIPVYDNERTVLQVALEARRLHPHVLVIDDGSTRLPDDFDNILKTNDIRLIRHPQNCGKGVALQTALKDLHERHVDYMITLDADGQHSPSDIPAFINLLEKEGQNRDLLVIGVRDFNAPNVPDSSKFGRKFSNFWIKLETGVTCADTQSGFRAYPVEPLSKLKFYCARYNFEIEVLTRGLWGGLQLRELPIHVTYEPPEKRISHFHPWKDNIRLSLLHTTLVTRRLLLFPHQRIVPKPKLQLPSLWKHPKEFFLYLLKENATPELLAISAGVSSFLAVLPLISCHMLVILYVCIRLNLNKIMALAIQNLYMPPFTPFLCIELGYFMRHGTFLREASLQTIVRELPYRFWEWLLGSLVIAPIAAILSGLITYVTAKRLQKS